MFDDVDISDNECPKCGAGYTYSRECNDCEDGFQNRYEEDPLWFDDVCDYPCDTCQTRGWHNWCPQCGWDLLENRYLGLPLVKYQPALLKL